MFLSDEGLRCDVDLFFLAMPSLSECYECWPEFADCCFLDLLFATDCVLVGCVLLPPEPPAEFVWLWGWEAGLDDFDGSSSGSSTALLRFFCFFLFFLLSCEF